MTESGLRSRNRDSSRSNSSKENRPRRSRSYDRGKGSRGRYLGDDRRHDDDRRREDRDDRKYRRREEYRHHEEYRRRRHSYDDDDEDDSLEDDRRDRYRRRDHHHHDDRRRRSHHRHHHDHHHYPQDYVDEPRHPHHPRLGGGSGRRHHRSRSRERRPPLSSVGPNHVRLPLPVYRVVEQAKDDRLGDGVQPDPRGTDPSRRITEKAASRGTGRNTESFDPASTLVRPDLRVHVGTPGPVFDGKLKHDDAVIVPELFGKRHDWSLYYQLVQEMTQLQSQEEGAEWISWHEGAHLISKKPEKSETFQMIIDRLCEYFNIKKETIGTRFNWYKDSSDWKPFHHDSAAFNPKRARNQNITVGVSFGATRELAFVRATPQEDGNKVRIYFPQTNNGVFSFGRDANILWKHGVNALHPEEQNGKGRISIILWGLAQDVVEEEGSPPLLGSDGHGPHSTRRRERDRRNGRR